MWHNISVLIAALFVVSFTHCVYRWRNPKCNGKLPPGSMGLPLLGETLQFFAPNRTWDTPPFIKERMKRYGSVFRTSIVGLKVIVSTDSDLNYMIFQQEDQFQSWYPDSMKKVFGGQNLSTLQGCLHKYLKNMVLNLVGSGTLINMISEVESAATRNLERWASQGVLELKDATADLVFSLTAKKLISFDLENSSENLRANFDAFIKGLISVPLAFPGTAYHKCLQGRKKVMKMLKNMLEERRANPKNSSYCDFFDYVLQELKQDDTILTQEIALDLMFMLLFASYETTSTAMLVAIKLLTDNPQALTELTEEHEKIIRKRENPDSGLTWEEYKSMTFTFKVIFESVRLANIAPGIFRKATTDIKFKDYTIPSGWVVMACPPAVHMNPVNYKDPVDFNPWRWEEMDLKTASKKFMAFGGGQRFCVGADFAKLQMAVFLHCLVTKYRWKLIKGGETVRTPGLLFPNGFHVHFFKKDDQNWDPISELANHPKKK